MTGAEVVALAGLISDLAERYERGSEAARLARMAAAFTAGAGAALSEGRWAEWSGKRVADVLPDPMDAAADIEARDAEIAARLRGG